eukprot:3940440-Rhodomonas_salina.1
MKVSLNPVTGTRFLSTAHAFSALHTLSQHCTRHALPPYAISVLHTPYAVSVLRVLSQYCSATTMRCISTAYATTIRSRSPAPLPLYAISFGDSTTRAVGT